jgi:plastocyanin
MSAMLLSRRALLAAGGLALAGWTTRPARAATTATIHLVSDTLGTQVGFDPIGIHVQPGTTVRWVVDGNVHTVTAYHPANAKHSLRIPATAKPWDSGYLVNPGDHFEVTLTAEGVYDYFCLPHEEAGMVGRIVVGRPGGPGALPFDYFKGRPEAKDWLPVSAAAQSAFPDVEDILTRKTIPLSKGHKLSAWCFGVPPIASR